MRVLIQPRDLEILQLAQSNMSIKQEQIPWRSSYQSKMRRLRKLCEIGLLKMQVPHRQEPNRYYLTDKGKRVLQMRRKMSYVKQKEVK